MTAARQTEATAPPHGTRPTNRRALTLAAAARLFHESGYQNVAMSDIADAVNVRPSALHRHFSNKDELFTAAAHAAPEPDLGAETPLPTGCGLTFHSRRERILTEAARLFAANGSASTWSASTAHSSPSSSSTEISCSKPNSTAFAKPSTTSSPNGSNCCEPSDRDWTRTRPVSRSRPP